MDEINVSSLRAPTPQRRVLSANPRDLSGLGDIVLNNERVDRLISQTQDIEKRGSLIAKRNLLDDLEEQYKVNEALISSAPRQIAQSTFGERVSRVGARPLIAEATGPAERQQLLLGTVIERVKGNISTAARLADETGSSATASQQATIAEFQSLGDNASAGTGLSDEEIEAQLEGKSAQVSEAQQEEAAKALAIADIVNITNDPMAVQRFSDSTLEDVLAEADRLAFQQEERNLEQTSDAQQIADRVNRQANFT